VTFTNNTAGGIIHDWAYDDSGSAITVGLPIPEPSRTALLALFLGGTCLRRRRAGAPHS
jgi:hypothetical protein